jgi:dihydrofolate reductase
VNALFSDAEVFFPEFDENEWEKKSFMRKEKDDKHPYSFVVYEYNKRD